MASIVVTGALGRVGTWTVDHLAACGHEITGIDVERPETGREGVHFYEAELTDQGQAWELVQTTDPDAVVHLAAIPAMGVTSGTETFANNVLSTYHVLVAAGEIGADIVWTSSESAYGMVFAEESWLPEYLPIDESHPMRPEDPYGTSKVVGEEIAKMVARKYAVPVTSIRPSWVQVPGEYQTQAVREEFDPETATLNFDYWSYVDARDVASLIGAALDRDDPGHEAYAAVADENYLDRPTAAVIEAVAGDLPDPCTLEGDEAAFTNEKASRELGWSPAHSWRTAEDESVEPPF